MKRTLVPLLAVAALSCGDPIHPPQVIEKTRVLGARAEAREDPARATVARGEDARVRWLVVDPTELPRLGFSLVACEPTHRVAGTRRCAAPPFARRVQAPSDDPEPALEFSVPSDYAGSSILVAGVVCFGGEPPDTETLLERWPAVTRCDGKRAQAVTFEVVVEQDGERNHNPSLEDDPIELGGASWALPTSLGTSESCADAAGAAELPRVSAEERTVAVRLTSEGDDREATAAEAGEYLLLSSYSTTGKLDRAFSTLEWEGAGTSDSISLEWTAPDQAPEDGRIVRFYFVARDDRGGVDWTERALCLVP